MNSAESGGWLLEVQARQSEFEGVLEPGASLRLGVRDGGVELVSQSEHCLELKTREDGLALSRRGQAPMLMVGGEPTDSALLQGEEVEFLFGGVAIKAVRSTTHGDAADATMGLVGRSASMVRLRHQVRRFAPLSRPVLIRGESGTGKEVVARALHKESRRTGPLHALNLGGLSEQFADAELFGHERGAFTGAVAKRQGAFQVAQGGTLFLDEIGDAPASVQVKLLRVLEEGEVRPLGSNKTFTVSPRLVTATWKRLDSPLFGGVFREDLLHRISTLQICVPPLRKRKCDIPLLAQHLLAKFRPELGQARINDGGLARLVLHAWPGNVRELSSVLYRCAVAAGDGEINAAVVAASIGVSAQPGREGIEFSEVKNQLRAHRGNVSATARSLGVPRSTLRAWLRRGSCETA